MLIFYHIVFISLLFFNDWVIAQPRNSTDSISTVSGLIFEKEMDYRLHDSTYSDIIQLLNLSVKAQAMQFRLLINKAPEDSTFLIFKDIQKGSDLNDPGWLLDFNVVKGQGFPNGASQDEIFIVLYNLNQNGGLLPGDYQNLFTVNYAIPELPGLTKDIKSSIKISHAEASTFQGFAIDIKPTRDELKIYIKRQ